MSTGEQQQEQSQAAEVNIESMTPLLDDMVEALPGAVKEDEANRWIGTLKDQVMDGVVVFDKSVTKTINAAIAKLDTALSQQLAAIMHNSAFQKLEGSWRGLNHLVMNSETGTGLKIRVTNLTKRELFKDLDRAVEFDQSTTFKKLYENEFGMPGGEPYGALIGDYEFTNHPEDIDLLEKMSGAAAAAFCPFISAAAPELFGLEDFTELSRPRDLAKIFMDKQHIKWNSFRDSEDSRFVCLTMPRVLSRLPYGASTKPIDEFAYEEVELDDEGNAMPVPHSDYAWMNSAYVMGTNLTSAFAQTGWCTAIRGVENGGKVEGLPAHVFKSDDGDEDLKCPTEVPITDRREKELSDLGFLPLSHFKNQDYSVFFGGQTTQKPKKYVNSDTTANANLSARLPYIMATARIAHFLKCIARDKIGAFAERQDLEDWLTRWISEYICADDKPSAEQKARFPLAEAKITVEEIPGEPGSYNAVAYLRPWLQLEELTTSMRLVAKIPAAKK